MVFGYSYGKKAVRSWALAMTILLGTLMVASMAQPAAKGQHITKEMIDGEYVNFVATPQDDTQIGWWQLGFYLFRQVSRPNQDAYFDSYLYFYHSSGTNLLQPLENSMQCNINKDGGSLVLDAPIPHYWGDVHNVIVTINLQWQCDARDRSRSCSSDYSTSNFGTTILVRNWDQAYKCQGPVFTGQLVVKIDDVEYMGKVQSLDSSTFKSASLDVWHA